MHKYIINFHSIFLTMGRIFFLVSLFLDLMVGGEYDSLFLNAILMY